MNGHEFHTKVVPQTSIFNHLVLKMSKNGHFQNISILFVIQY